MNTKLGNKSLKVAHFHIGGRGEQLQAVPGDEGHEAPVTIRLTVLSSFNVFINKFLIHADILIFKYL